MKTKTMVIILILFCSFFADTGFSQDLKQYIADSLGKGHKTIIVPEGKYFVNGIISFGPKYCGTKVAAENENVKIFSSQREPVFSINNVTDFELSGFTLKSLPESPESKVGFYFQGGGPDWTSGSRAFWVEDSSRIKVSNNHIDGYWIGIYITAKATSTSYVDVVNNDITNCGYWSIAARYKTHSKNLIERRLQHISFLENKVSNSEQGPVFRNVSYGVMNQNKVFRNIIGIRIEQSLFCVIKDNDISKNLQSGIFIYHDSNYNHIINNIIYDNNLQAARIKRIAKERNCDEDFLPGDIERFRRHPKNTFREYADLVGNFTDMLSYNPEYWPYPTAYDFITPSNRVKNYLDPKLNKKFWGLYFSQWGAVGIELRSGSSHNLIEHNKIFNSSPINIKDGYMIYGIKISHLAVSDSIAKFNIIRDNDIENMVSGPVLDVNKRHGIDGENVIK